MGSLGVGPALQRRRPGHRRGRRPDRRRPRPGRRPCQPWSRRRQGSLRMAGQFVSGPTDPPARPAARSAGRGDVGRRHGTHRRTVPGSTRRIRTRRDRLLHVRTALLGGVLHARGHRARRHRHRPRGRQHPVVHCDGRRSAEGLVRQRRSARHLHRPRPCRHHRAVRAQHRRDPERHVDAHPRPTRGSPPAGHHLRRSADDAGGPACHRPSGTAARHERRADERAAARNNRQRLGRPRLHRLAHSRFRRPASDGRRLSTGTRRRDLRCPGRRSPSRRTSVGQRRTTGVDGVAGLLPIAPGDRRGGSGQQHPPHPGDARAARLRSAADERPAHRREHQGVRGRRRSRGVPKLGERRARARTGRPVEHRERPAPA